MKYSRSFITLTQFDDDYTTENKKALGKSVIEMKNERGKIFIWVQDLKPEIFYNIYLIYKVNDKKFGVYITDIFVNSKGKGELKYSFDIKDIFSTNFKVDEYVCIALIVNKDGIKTPLIGYRNELIDWDNNFESINKTLEKKEKMQKEENIKTEPVKKVLTNENKIDRLYLDFNNYIVGFEEELEELSEKKFSYKDELNKISKQNEYINLESSIKKNIRMKPFEKQNRDVYWVRASIDEIDNFGSVKKEEFLVDSYNTYKHLILGYVKDYGGENYYLGVPDIYEPKKNKTAFDLGFIQFKCCDSVKPHEGAYGYWIMKT